MAFSTPRDWASGELVTHTIMNAHVRDQFSALSLHTHSGSAGDGASALDNVDTITYDHQGSDPSAPSSGHGTVYFKSDGLYFRNTGGTATRLALSSDVLTVGQIVEADGVVTIDYGGGTTSEQTVITTNVTAGGSGRYYVVTASAICTYNSGTDINPTIKVYYDTTVRETVTTSTWRTNVDATTGNGTTVHVSQTQANPVASAKALKITAQGTAGNIGTIRGTISIREIYTA
jgi:hypothetical protein